jgi:hypothetical protein
MSFANLVEFIFTHYWRDKLVAAYLAAETFERVRQGDSGDLRTIAGNCAINYGGSIPQPSGRFNNLPELECRAMTLLYFDNVTEREAAKRLGVTRHVLRRTLNSALAKMRAA